MHHTGFASLLTLGILLELHYQAHYMQALMHSPSAYSRSFHASPQCVSFCSFILQEEAFLQHDTMKLDVDKLRQQLTAKAEEVLELEVSFWSTSFACSLKSTDLMIDRLS